MNTTRFLLNVDGAQLYEKPPKNDPYTYGALRKRLCNVSSLRELTAADLARAVEEGRSFTPAALAGTRGEDWKSQQVLCVDVDNKQPDPLPSDVAIGVLSFYACAPTFAYHTFSSTPDREKYRLVFVLDQVLGDQVQAADYSLRLNTVLENAKEGCTDSTNADAARLYLGSVPGSVFYRGNIVSLDDLRRFLPDLQQKEDQQEEKTPRPAADTVFSGDDTQLEADKREFDLAGYIDATTASKRVKKGKSTFFNPCPICGHSDCFTVSGGLYYCHSDGHTEHKGGSVVDYLMGAEGIDRAAAVKRFMYDIMGHAPEATRTTAAEAFTEAPQRTPAQAMKSFLSRVQGRTYTPLQTGIPSVDTALSGGLIRQTLVLLGGSPGAGKTALAVQLLEGMAAAGHSVLFFTLEMSEEQMLSRALSRRLWARRRVDMSFLQILQGYRWTEEQRREILQAAEEYTSDIGDNMTYTGASAKLDDVLQLMEQAAIREKSAGKAAPMICIDYLQLLQGREREDDQQTLKRAVKSFKDFAIRHDTCVFCLQAYNRDSIEKGRADMTSGRDTSAIEYTADLLLGLPYTAVDEQRPNQRRKKKGGQFYPYDVGDINALLKQANANGEEPPIICREISLKVIKNRYGAAPTYARLLFDRKHFVFDQAAAYHAFTEEPDSPEDKDHAEDLDGVDDLTEYRGNRTIQEIAKKTGLSAARIAAIEAGHGEDLQEEKEILLSFYREQE